MCPSVEDCFLCFVCGACVCRSQVCASGQWMCLRLSSVRLLSHFKFMVACPSPFTPVSRCVSAPVRTYLMSPNGWLLASVGLVWLCLSMCFFSLLLSMSVHRVPSREEVCCVLACHLVPCCVVLPWTALVFVNGTVSDCSGCNRPVCPRPVLLICADC